MHHSVAIDLSFKVFNRLLYKGRYQSVHLHSLFYLCCICFLETWSEIDLLIASQAPNGLTATESQWITWWNSKTIKMKDRL